MRYKDSREPQTNITFLIALGLAIALFSSAIVLGIASIWIAGVVGSKLLSTGVVLGFVSTVVFMFSFLLYDEPQ